MNTPGENNIWTPSRLRTQLAAQKGLAPAPSCYIVWRSTTRSNAPDAGGYELPGDPGRHDESAFERWLIERNLAGPERLSVSVLVIREQLDDTGLLRDCVLERRRGGAEGPYYGNVARVEFAGAAKQQRIAALEAHHRTARAGMLDHQRVDFILRDGLCPAALAYIHNHCRLRDKIKNRLRNKIVMNNHVGRLDEPHGFDCEQIGISWTCADEGDES